HNLPSPHLVFCTCTTVISYSPLSFFFILPPPPSSTLFPYTTLFRSGGTSGSGPFHSQNMEAIYAHYPGLVVMTPATVEDAYHMRSEEHTSELQSPDHLVCRLLLEKKKKKYKTVNNSTKNLR